MLELNQENFKAIIQQDKLVVVDFYATWCMPCRMLKPILEKAESKLDEVAFYNLDVDEEEEIAKRYRIFSVPTVVCFKKGHKIDSMVGLNSLDDIVDFVKRCDSTPIAED